MPDGTDDAYVCEPCRRRIHVDCTREVEVDSVGHPCACFRSKVKAHSKLFQQEALLKMMDRLQEAGCLVVLPGEPLPVYRLETVSDYYGSHKFDLYLTEDAAKAAGQKILDEWQAMLDEGGQEMRDETEEITVRKLEWHDAADWFKIGKQRQYTGHTAPYAWYNHQSAFKITTIEVTW